METSFKDGELSIASADASFRRYFRLKHQEQSYIVMDAPPDLEASLPFVQIGEWMKKSGINVPEIFAKDLELGFMVLSDFGDFHFQDALVREEKDDLYNLAINEIVKLQSYSPSQRKTFPALTLPGKQRNLKFFGNGAYPTHLNQTTKELLNHLHIRLIKSPKLLCTGTFIVETYSFATTEN